MTIGWGLLFNRYTLAALLAGAAYFAVRSVVDHIEQRGYDRAMAEVAQERARATIRALKAEAERDNLAHEIAGEALRESARRQAETLVGLRLSLERIAPLLPDVDPSGSGIPVGVWEELDAARERADAAGRDGL